MPCTRKPCRRSLAVPMIVIALSTVSMGVLLADESSSDPPPEIVRLLGLGPQTAAPNPDAGMLQRGSTDWAALIDSTWGSSPLSRAQRVNIFDTFWNEIDTDYACFQDLNLDWDALRSLYLPEIAFSISRGRFAFIMGNLGRQLKDGHGTATDLVISGTAYAPGVPLFALATWGWVTHSGMALAPQDDKSALVYEVVSPHPLGLVPGDKILGYDGRPWADLYRELLDVYELPKRGHWIGSSESAAEHMLLATSGMNWHLFTTIDVLKHDTGEVQHLPTSLMSGLPANNLFASEQLDVPGIAKPDINTSNWVTWGVLSGSNIGYINVLAWQALSGIAFEQAIDDLTQTQDVDGLIVDFRLNLGGNMFESNDGLAVLFNTSTPTVGFHERCGDPDDHFSMCSAGSTSNWDIPADPTNQYVKPIAVLTGPGAISSGDQVALRFKFLSNARWFGKSTSATFNAPVNVVFADPDWFGRYGASDAYLISEPGEYLTHDEQDVYCNVWLEPDDVSQGTDTVLQAAIGWIEGTQPDPDFDSVGDPCDNCPDMANLSQTDTDYDGWGDSCDCVSGDRTVYPGAVELNDGIDNNCPGDAGFGLVDELGSNSNFLNNSDPDEYVWFGQTGSAEYQVARSTSPEFTTDCVLTSTPETLLVDTDDPATGQVFHYLNRSLSPFPGSWGNGSDSLPRSVCGT